MCSFGNDDKNRHLYIFSTDHFSEYFLFTDGEQRIQKANSILLSKLYLNLTLFLCHCLWSNSLKVKMESPRLLEHTTKFILTCYQNQERSGNFPEGISFSRHDNELLSDLILIRQPEVTSVICLLSCPFFCLHILQGK